MQVGSAPSRDAGGRLLWVARDCALEGHQGDKPGLLAPPPLPQNLKRYLTSLACQALNLKYNAYQNGTQLPHRLSGLFLPADKIREMRSAPRVVESRHGP